MNGLKLINTENLLDVTPENIAVFYSEMTSDHQAKFFDIVACEFGNFQNGGLCMQNCMIAEDLTDKAKDYIKNLYQHAFKDA